MDNDPPKPPPSTMGDAPDKEKMDQIRRQRLEKLQGSRQSPKPADENASPSGSSTPTSSSTPRPNINISSAASSQSASNPFSKLGVQPSSLQSQPARISADSSAKRGRAMPDETATPPVRKTATPLKEETVEEFENRVLSQIFRITLDPHHTTDSAGHKLHFLIDLHQELSEASEPLRLTVGSLDSALSEAASKLPHSRSVLDYLLPSWKRIAIAAKSLRNPSPEKQAVLKEARRLCMSYCSFAVVMPEFFGREPNLTTDTLVPHFLLDSDNERGIDHQFLTEAAARLEEDEMVKPMILKAVAGLSFQLSSLTMNDGYKVFVNALKSLSLFPNILTAIAEDPLFQMATSAPGIEKLTILGPYFRISPLQPEVTKVYFAGPKTMDKAHIKTSQNALRLTLNTHQQDLLDIVNAFVRASTTARNRTLDWFAYVVNSNHKRGAMRVDENSVSSDGFMSNVSVVLDGLCVPFMDSTFSKVSKIDPDYLRRSPRVDIKEETKINADQSASDAFYSKLAEGSSNFISEVFFLTLAAHHYGSGATNNKLKNLEKDIKYFEKQLAQMEAERAKFLNNPRQLAIFEHSLKRYTDIMEKAMSLKFAIEGVLFDDQMQGRSLLFMRYVIVFMLRIATGSDYTPSKTLNLPLPNEQPEVFKTLPEYFLEDVVDNFKFIFRFVPHVITSTQTDELIALCIVFLRSSEYIKNPGIKSGLVSLLYHGIWPIYHRQKGVLGDALMGDKFANDHLLHALMKYFIEAESTGTSSQFYDKFNIRYEIFQVIKCIWTNDIYKKRLTQESKHNTAFFVRFVNLLLNDATWVLDEALTKFPKIHTLQDALRNPGELSQEERSAKEEELQQAENQATSYMQLANETMAMMKLFTAALGESFTMPEIVQRLADMLDLNLDTLVGPKSTNLKVNNPDKYHFNPRHLLAELIDIYLNLGKWHPFVQAVARDGRSYKPEIFDNATRIVTRVSLKSPEELEAWQDLKERIRKAKEQDDQDEEDLGEVPDELQDPIMSGLMEDPVILPHSKITIDRSTITAHLLNDPKDPFNRQPMKIEDVIPDVEMKERIRKFREERKALKQRGGDAMDTSA